MIRVTAGLLLLPHGSQKLFGWFGGKGMQATAQFFASAGFEPGWFWALLVALTEFVGGLCLALGFLTRPAAAAIAGFMAVAVVQTHWPNGFFWTDKGFEYPLMWGIVALLAFVILGGGRYSVDAEDRRAGSDWHRLTPLAEAAPASSSKLFPPPSSAADLPVAGCQRRTATSTYWGLISMEKTRRMVASPTCVGRSDPRDWHIRTPSWLNEITACDPVDRFRKPCDRLRQVG